MTLGRLQRGCHQGLLRWLTVVLLGTAVALPPARAQSPERATEELGAQLTQKIDQILRYAKSEATEPRLTILPESEINAYLRHQGAAQLPEGLSNPTLRITDGLRVRADATVDLDAIRDQRQRTWFDPLQYLGGQLPVSASGTIASGNGAARVAIDRITISGVPMPVQVLQELVGYYTRTADHPDGTRLDQPIPLPYGISELRLTPGRAVIVQ